MYRAGSTWQYLVASDLVEAQRGGKRVGFADFNPALESCKMAIDHRWRSAKLHDRSDVWAFLLAVRAALGIYIYRDVREVAFSLAHLRELPFDEIVRHGTLQRLLDNDAFWRSRRNVLVQKYETVVSDYPTAIAQIAEHLRIPVSDSRIAELADKYSFQENLRRTIEFRKSLQTSCDLSDPQVIGVRDKRTELHWNHLRDPNHASWRDSASPKQVETLHAVCGDWLAANGYALA
jgi:hypothetical protein